MTISVEELEGHLIVSVRDRGPGIPPDELRSVFEKFVQSSLTKSGAGGTGLGLAIAHEILLAHHGRIWADNAPDGGAIFSFTLPLGGDATGTNESATPRAELDAAA